MGKEPKTATQILVAILVAAFVAALVLLWAKHARANHEPFECEGEWCKVRKEVLYELIRETGESYALQLCGWAK